MTSWQNKKLDSLFGKAPLSYDESIDIPSHLQPYIKPTSFSSQTNDDRKLDTNEYNCKDTSSKPSNQCSFSENPNMPEYAPWNSNDDNSFSKSNTNVDIITLEQLNKLNKLLKRKMKLKENKQKKKIKNLKHLKNTCTQTSVVKQTIESGTQTELIDFIKIYGNKINHKMNNMIQKLSKQIDLKQEIILNTQKENKFYEKAVSSKEKELIEYKLEIDRLKMKISDMNIIHTNLKDQLEEKENIEGILKNEINLLEKNLNECNKKLEISLRPSNEELNEIKELRELLMHSEQEKNEYKHKWLKISQKCDDLETQKTMLETRIQSDMDQYKQQIESFKIIMEQSYSNMNNNLIKITNENNSLRTENAKLLLDLGKMQSSKITDHDKFDNIQKIMDEKDEEIVKLKREMNYYNNKKIDFESICDMNEVEMEKKENEMKKPIHYNDCGVQVCVDNCNKELNHVANELYKTINLFKEKAKTIMYEIGLQSPLMSPKSKANKFWSRNNSDNEDDYKNRFKECTQITKELSLWFEDLKANFVADKHCGNFIAQ